MTIKDYKDQVDNDIEINIEERTDIYDPKPKTLYRGILKECPGNLDNLTINIVGYSISGGLEGRELYHLFHLITQ